MKQARLARQLRPQSNLGSYPTLETRRLSTQPQKNRDRLYGQVTVPELTYEDFTGVTGSNQHTPEKMGNSDISKTRGAFERAQSAEPINRMPQSNPYANEQVHNSDITHGQFFSLGGTAEGASTANYTIPKRKSSQNEVSRGKKEQRQFKKMMNKWRDLIATQEDHGKSVEHTIKQNKIAHLRDRQMKAGFRA